MYTVAWEPGVFSYNILEASIRTHVTGWYKIQPEFLSGIKMFKSFNIDAN